jgi:hypothetical protein
LDFVGAFADDHQGCIAEVPFDIVFGGVAVSAMDPDGIQGDFHRDF